MMQLEYALPGVARMERLFGHYRLALEIPQAPVMLEVKAFIGEDGQYRLKTSHRPVTKGRPLVKARADGRTPFEVLMEGPFPSLEIALMDLVRALAVATAGSRQVTWEANPQF